MSQAKLHHRFEHIQKLHKSQKSQKLTKGMKQRKKKSKSRMMEQNVRNPFFHYYYRNKEVRNKKFKQKRQHVKMTKSHNFLRRGQSNQRYNKSS